MKVLTVVGARPQFIKAAAVSRRLRLDHTEILVHTGQHYDYEMSGVFFDELPLPLLDHSLDVGSGSHAVQTAEIMVRLEPLIVRERPDVVLVYGDTNSTLAAALTAVKLQVPVAHVEAGVRSFRLDAPEEVNRIATDHLSRILFCPTSSAMRLLEREGLDGRARFSGDVMLDILLESIPRARLQSQVLRTLGLNPRQFLLCTIHRPRNTDHAARLGAIFSTLANCGRQVVIPLHPRTRTLMEKDGSLARYAEIPTIRMVPPVGYLDMLMLEENAAKIVTDSGGVQREAYVLGVPCITCDDRTEWIETIDDGWNVLVDADGEAILQALEEFEPAGSRHDHFGYGDAAREIATGLSDVL